MKPVPMAPLETPRLLLRKFRPDDLQAHYKHITSDPEVAKTMLWEANPDPAHAQTVLNRILASYETQDCYRWAIARKTDDAYLGTISLLRLDTETGTCSFAYMLGREFWGQGYGTEALQAVFRFAFVDLELDAIAADHFAGNPASGAVMKKAGMTQTNFLPGKYSKNGIPLDAVAYRITREAWLCFER